MPKYKKILYIGPYREFSGAGNAARNYIRAFIECGHDICIAPMFYTGEIYADNEIASDILPLEHNHLKNYDIVIQHCHPFDYVYSNNFDMNIGLYQFNSATVDTSIISRLKLMDRIIVNSKFNATIINSISNQVNLDVIPELIDVNLKNEEYITYEWQKQQYPPKIIFYTIGDFIERKNIETIIRAFLYTFHEQDDVELIIKTKPHYSHNNPEFINQELEYSINKVYASLRKTKTQAKQPKIMLGQFNYQYLLAMHKNSNIYIDASMAENFGYSCLEACLFDNYLIVNENSSTAEISNNAIKTMSKTTNIIDSHSSNFIDNTINNIWYQVDFESLCNNLWQTYLKALIAPKTQHDLSPYQYSRIQEYFQ